MSLIAYRESQKLAYEDPSFDAYIMAAMRKADDSNLEKLKMAFPEVWEELKARYNAPGGCLNEQETKCLMRILELEQTEEPEEETIDDND